MKKSNFELMRPDLSEDWKTFWEMKLRKEIQEIKLGKSLLPEAREFDFETQQSQYNKLEAQVAGTRIKVRQACIIIGNKLQLDLNVQDDKNHLTSELNWRGSNATVMLQRENQQGGLSSIEELARATIKKLTQRMTEHNKAMAAAKSDEAKASVMSLSWRAFFNLLHNLQKAQKQNTTGLQTCNHILAMTQVILERVGNGDPSFIGVTVACTL
ncbi:hypothetical protein LOK49_LG11G00987 [Camellia lanceoleosa]|uniref:Uncharacterized protein n=1 Tax=Camellia lanceoleosa TaxID=1840588 RepID=A0ACC0FZ23_9ERIC|nr:hypothetical protein LOK49_LG11G00987 [Camellia lanceoleosa]